MIAADPHFDFSAVAQVHADIMAVCNRIAAVLLVSEDLDELLSVLTDRIVVTFRRRLVHEMRVSEADLTEIGRCYVAGHCMP
jgi:simple sugar transport system ATP-binding protein